MRRNRLALFIAIALIPVIGSLLVALYKQFDGLYGQDAFAYYNYATIALKNQLFPPPPFFWPPGYPLLVLLASVFVGVTPLAGQVVSLIGGFVVTLGTMLIVEELVLSPPLNPLPEKQGGDFNSPLQSLVGVQSIAPLHTKFGISSELIAPIAAGLVMGLCGQIWQSSNVIMADTTSLAAATIGVWAALRYANRLRTESGKVSAIWLALAGGAVAYAMITRWAYVVVAFASAPYVLIVMVNQVKTGKLIPRTAITHAVIASIVGVLILAPVLGAALFSPRTLDTTYGGNFQYQFTHWNLANALKRDFVNPDGHESFTLINSIFYASLPFRTFYLTPVMLPFALVGLLWIVQNKFIWRMLPVLLWGIIAYVLLIGGAQQNSRFALTYLPPIVVLIGLGIGAVWRWQHSLIKGGVLLMLCGGLVWEGISAYATTSEFIDRKNAMMSVVTWTEAQIPSDAQVITLGPTLMMQHYTTIDTHEIYYLVPDDLPSLIEVNQPTYVLLDLYNVETQWLGRSPSDNYHWLRDHTTLQKIGTHGGYTLFAVNP